MMTTVGPAWARLTLAAAGLSVPLLAGAASAASSPATVDRTTSMSYSQAGGVATPVGQPVLFGASDTQTARAAEDRVEVRVADSSRRPVAIKVVWRPRGTSGATSKVFCGSTPTLPIQARSSVTVTTLTGTCPDGSSSIPTGGRISTVFTRPVKPVTIGPADRWAVLVGVQDYAGDTHPTYGGRGDVSAIRTALLRSGWRSDHIRTLLDGQATAAGITEAMSWLAERSGPGTFSLFHFSGHVCIASRGPCAAGHTYLWSEDNRFVPESTVGAALGRVQGRAWFDFAGCESGAFDAGLSSAKRLVTGSSRASETSYEQPSWKQSVWTGLVWDQAFLQGRAGPAAGRATIGQMVAFGQAQAPRTTANQAAGPQHPYVAGGDPNQTLFAPTP